MDDVLIVGGGIAGLQAAIQLGRYERRVLVLDRGGGRSALCRNYSNILGWPDGVSGQDLRDRGRMHASRYGVRFQDDEIVRAGKLPEGGFRLEGRRGQYEGRTLLFATGITDRLPELDGLNECLGRSVFICPDCDGYETRSRRTAVIGSGDAGARMALALSYWCRDLTLVNHEPEHAVSGDLARRLQEKDIPVIPQRVVRLTQQNGFIESLLLEDGSEVKAQVGFAALGGAAVNSDLARQLGAERLENRHVLADPRSKMSSVPGVWIAGDIGVHSEQVTVAMAEGTLCAIWMHKYLMEHWPVNPHQPPNLRSITSR